MFIAHKNDNGQNQTVKEHCLNTAELSCSFAVDFMKNIAYNTGLLHDVGKYQPTFQKRIEGDDIKIPHALCGAKEIDSIYKKSYAQYMMEYCIAGHHTGLQDFGSFSDTEDEPTLCGTLKKETEDYSDYEEIDKLRENLKNIDDDIDVIKNLCSLDCLKDFSKSGKIAFLTRYLFSCLTDADSTDTADFCSGVKKLGLKSDFQKCLEIINEKLNSFDSVTDLQKARGVISKQVYEKINTDGKVFIMNMPTGSGKTLCSMKFALERAIKNNKKRIIYVIPYNSIIDQTAEEFENLFDKTLHILRHQSSFDYENQVDYSEDYKQWYKKSIENWDADFIITTSVQFFESVFNNKRGKLRKLHNMENSIIVFDEAHLMPLEFLQPSLQAISHITTFLNTEVLFLSATMPDYKNILIDNGIKPDEIISLVEDKSQFDKFRKCDYTYIDNISVEELLLKTSPSRLIITNSKKSARELFSQATGEKYQLSTYIIGKEREKKISFIKERLKLLSKEFKSEDDIPTDRYITVVSTSLVEAGVDFDFHTVFREINGLDHILQSGGRCNREGKRKDSKTFIFSLLDNSGRSISREVSITKGILEKGSDINNISVIEDYYKRLFILKDDEIKSHMMEFNVKKPYIIQFKSYAEKMKLIDDNSFSIVVPIDDYSKNLEEIAKNTGYSMARKLQKYTAQVSFTELDTLQKQGVLNDYNSGVYFLTSLDYYDKEIGILFTGKDYII